MAKKQAAEKKSALQAVPEAPAAEAPAEPKVTKSQAIRDALKADPNKGPAAIAADLTVQGIDVKPYDVSNVKFQLKAKRRRKRAAAKAAAVAAEPQKAAPASDDLISLAALQAAKTLAAELGGVEKAKQAINSLARLVD